MRPLAHFLIIWGVILLLFAAYDEHREIASVIPPGRYGRRQIIKKADKPEEFRNLMIYQWLRDSLVVSAGFIILGMCRRADSLDPFSPDFAGKSEIDDLERTLDEEEQKRHRPLK